jgi:hypothetical protein
MEADADTQTKIVFFLTQFWSFFAVSIGVAMGGIAAKRVVAVLVPAERQVAAAEDGKTVTVAEIATDPKLPLWYRLWRATISMHPVLVGGLTGFAPIPVANWVPDGNSAHVLWFALAGAVSGQVFEMGKRAAEILPAIVRQKLGVRSEPPPPAVAAVPALAETLEPEDKSPPKG